MRTFKTLAALTIAASALSACTNTVPALTGKPRDPVAAVIRETEKVTEDGLEVKYDPRVDILIVLDDSKSMAEHTENLSRNIKQFINEFAKTKGVDYHIGFTFTHDSSRYKPEIVPQVCEATGKTLWSVPGTLQPLVGFDKGRRYLTPEDSDQLVTVLTNSLDPKVKDSPLVKSYSNGPNDVNNGAMPCPQGAEHEESFTPLLGALSNAELSKDATSPNAGFRRPGAFFVAIIVSDAKDALVGIPADRGGITEQQVFDQMSELTKSEDYPGQQRFRVFAVAIKPGVVLQKSQPNRCVPDPAFNEPTANGSTTLRPHMVEEDENPLAILAKMTADGGQDQVLSICDESYGKKLAEYGRQVREDALPDVRISLNKLPSASLDGSQRLKVSVGPDELEFDKQWYYNNDNSITVVGKNIDWSKYTDGDNKIVVVNVPIDLTDETAKPIR